MKSTFIQTCVFAGISFASLALVSAQTSSTGGNVVFPAPGPATAQVGGEAIGFQFVGGGLGVSTNVVKNAAFSLDATVESTQTLADGNRIVHRQEVRLYRDSLGRTRREETLEAIGPWSASGAPPRMITIQDPVSGASYSLDTEHKVATKLPSLGHGEAVMVTGGPGGGIAVRRSLAAGGSAAPGPVTIDKNAISQTFFAGQEVGPTVILSTEAQGQALQMEDKAESLGKQTIAGVSADGTRIKTTIPANTIGNERPLDIVREQWYASDLEIVLRSKRTDPRFGDTSYEVTKIDRAEPAANLFEVPSDYKVVKMPMPPLPPFAEQK